MIWNTCWNRNSKDRMISSAENIELEESVLVRSELSVGIALIAVKNYLTCMIGFTRFRAPLTRTG